MTDTTAEAQPWPNQTEPVDGVVPATEVDQDPTLFDDVEDDDLEMEV